jgi:hypothetical protein
VRWNTSVRTQDDDAHRVRFDGGPTEVKPAPLLGEHTAPDVLADWLGLDADTVAGLQDGIV